MTNRLKMIRLIHMNDSIERLNPRQKLILNLTSSSNGLSREDIQKSVEPKFPASKPTIIRDLNVLSKLGLVTSVGKARAKVYKPTNGSPLLVYFDLDAYFERDPDKRVDAKKSFDFSIFRHLKNLLNLNEIRELKNNSKSFNKQTKALDPEILRKELERFTIELAWKSSKIEGNTYSLLETERLIKEFEEAENKTKKEKQMILNHKEAFEAILKNKLDFKNLSVSIINQLHNILVQGLDINPGIRKQPVGITGTAYKPLDNEFQIKEALEKTASSINAKKSPLEKALIAGPLISYIQPFVDGNKRTSRMLTNAILLAHDLYPLSYRSIDEEEYKKALILFYEQGSLFHLKRIFIDQLNFANKTYFT